MKKYHFFLILVLLVACNSLESPKIIFDTYVEQEKIGFTSFESFIKYYSKRKQKEIEIAVTEILDKNPEKKEEIVKQNSLKHFQHFAKCKEYNFKSEEIKEAKAILTYSVHNNCGNDNFFNTEIIYMLDENGWKIDKVDIKF